MQFDTTERPTARNFKDLTGKQYGRLTVLGFAGLKRMSKDSQTMRSYWLCRCSCPDKTETIVRRDMLGVTNSCGCLQREYAASGIAPLKHGHSIGHSSEGKPVSPEYSAWVSMKTRCLNPNANKYPDYGGRGIRIGDRYLNSFENFLTDLGRKPSSRHSLHRIDNDGNYEPGNVCWATKSIQEKNKRPDRDTIDRIGDTYGRLTVVKFAGSRGKRKKRYWICQCECGRQIEVRSDKLRKRASCGQC